jgi:hypothetical protein
VSSLDKKRPCALSSASRGGHFSRFPACSGRREGSQGAKLAFWDGCVVELGEIKFGVAFFWVAHGPLSFRNIIDFSPLG